MPILIFSPVQIINNYESPSRCLNDLILKLFRFHIVIYICRVKNRDSYQGDASLLCTSVVRVIVMVIEKAKQN